MENENIAAVAEETGGNAQDVADPAETVDAEGEKGQEVTAPAESSEEMPADERRQQAAQRRENERIEAQRRIDAEVERRTKEGIDKFIAAQNRINPKTGKPITTRDEYDEVESAARRRRREESLKKAGVDPAVIEEFINEHPDVKAAKQAQTEAEAAKARYDKLSKEESVREELRKIQRIDPNIRSAQELMAHPKYSEIRRLIQENNHTISEAFDIATKDDRDARMQAGAKSSAAAMAGSKAHMVSSSGAGAGAGEVLAIPAETVKLYKKMNPRMTEDEMRRRYASYQSHLKKSKKG